MNRRTCRAVVLRARKDIHYKVSRRSRKYEGDESTWMRCIRSTYACRVPISHAWRGKRVTCGYDYTHGIFCMSIATPQMTVQRLSPLPERATAFNSCLWQRREIVIYRIISLRLTLTRSLLLFVSQCRSRIKRLVRVNSEYFRLANEVLFGEFLDIAGRSSAPKVEWLERLWALEGVTAWLDIW